MPKDTISPDASPDPSPAVHQERAFFRELIPVAGIDSEVALNIIRAGHFLLGDLAGNLRAHGMSEAQFNVLVVLEDVPEGLTMAQIARRMLVSRAGVSGVVRGLADEGWVVCHPCPEDARAVRVCLAAAGRERLESFLPGHLERVRDLVGTCYSRRDKETLVRLLTRLRERLAERRTRRGHKGESKEE